jgi:hypothetical protein
VSGSPPGSNFDDPILIDGLYSLIILSLT